MKLTRRFLLQSIIALSLLSAACSETAPANNNQVNGNANVAQSNQTNSNLAQKAQQKNTGSIEVISAPPGAGVTLIPTDETGAGTPRSYGLTPTTITDLTPGKYMVNIQKNGYGYFQKEVEVAVNKAVKINASLKKQGRK
jgi:uncharacterized membrane protein